MFVALFDYDLQIVKNWNMLNLKRNDYTADIWEQHQTEGTRLIIYLITHNLDVLKF